MQWYDSVEQVIQKPILCLDIILQCFYPEFIVKNKYCELRCAKTCNMVGDYPERELGYSSAKKFYKLLLQTIFVVASVQGVNEPPVDFTNSF